MLGFVSRSSDMHVHESVFRFYASGFSSMKSCFFCGIRLQTINVAMCESPSEFCIVLYSGMPSISASFLSFKTWASELWPRSSFDIKEIIVTEMIGSCCTTTFSTGSSSDLSIASMSFSILSPAPFGLPPSSSDVSSVSSLLDSGAIRSLCTSKLW